MLTTDCMEMVDYLMMARLAILWKNKAIGFPTKIILHRSLVGTSLWI